jgi:hypothetical protein
MGQYIKWIVALSWVAAPTIVAAQCVPPENSNDARLLAFYEDPIVFSTATAPQALGLGHLSLTGELTGVPTPSNALNRTTYCFQAKQEGTHLSPVLPRPRIAVGLPYGFAIEASYLPPVTVASAQPNLGSGALTYFHPLVATPGPGSTRVDFGWRLDGTIGTVKGPITCPQSALQQSNPNGSCYGTKPSDDTFYPRSIATDGTIAVRPLGGRVTVYGGAGYSWLSPHFEVGFTSSNGFTDNTKIEVDLRRATVFGGVAVAIIAGLDAGAQVYSAPADLTTWRLTARYRL